MFPATGRRGTSRCQWDLTHKTGPTFGTPLATNTKKTGRESGEIKTMPLWGIRPGARTGGWQGAGATLVATNAATRLRRLYGLPKQNYIFRH